MRSSTRPLVWCGPVFEPTGYADEVRGMVASLEATGVPVCLRPPPLDSPGFRGTLSADHRAILERSVSRPIEAEFIQLQHGTLDSFGPQHQNAVYSVGRSMLETDSMPSHWVSAANALDELWVTGTFNLETFRSAGVRVPMHIIPGGIDSEFFRPTAEPLKIAGLRGTVYLSVFEWRLRKGWDVLLRAWADAFSPDDDVTLVLRSYPIGKVDGRRNADVINERIDAFLGEHCGRTRADIAPIVVLGERVDAASLPALYAMASAFVLPTRGEGWGRPFMESMACGVPVIATNWSAHLAFMHSENSYLVNVDKLVPADATEVPIYAGQRWAEPSASHLATQLRRVYGDRAEARAIGARARHEMVEDWSWTRTARAITARLEAIDGQLDRMVGVSPTRSVHAGGVVVDGGHGDPLQPPSNATMWLDALVNETKDITPVSVAWRTNSRGPRPSYSSPDYHLWMRSQNQIDSPAVQVTVLDDHAFITAPSAPSHGMWVVDVESVVTDRVPPHLVTILRDQADRVVVPHEVARAACRDIGVDDARMDVVTPVVDCRRFTPVGAPYRHAKTAGTRFLLIGGDRDHRALQRTIAAYERAFTARDDVLLHVVLPPSRPGEHIAWRARTIADAVAGKRHPVLPKLWIDTHAICTDELPALYRTADVLIHAGSATGRGRTLRESMACGTPVIATDVEPARGLVDAHCGWLVPRGPTGHADQAALTHALRAAAASTATERTTRAERARERALTWVSRDATRTRLWEYLHALRELAPRRFTGDAMPAHLVPFHFEGARRVVLLAHADWHSGAAQAVVRTFAMACSDRDNVTLALCLDPAQGLSTEQVVQLVHEAVRAAHRVDATMPDVLLVTDMLDAMTLHRLRAAADIVVAVRDPAGAAMARHAQRDVLESLDVASWQSAIARRLAMLQAA